MPISSDEFRAALSKFASGVTVVTTKDNDGNLYGITVSAFCSLSLEPPLILICIEKSAACHFAVSESGVFAVNVLSADQAHHSDHFALSIPDKFRTVEHDQTANGLPLLKESIVSLECELVNSHENGDHTIFVGKVEKTFLNGGSEPLLYFDGLYRSVGESIG